MYINDRRCLTLETKPKLQQILDQRGWTQTELASRSGVSQTFISRFDKSVQGTYSHMFKIARALNLTAEELFSGTEYMWFADEKHLEFLSSFTDKVCGDPIPDRYFGSALYILSFIESQDRKGMDRYLERGSIDFPTMREKVDFSTGQRALFNLAANCFNDSNKADVAETFKYVSGDYLRMALEAIKYRYKTK